MDVPSSSTYQKRIRLFNEAINDRPAPRRCVEDLDDFEIKECAKIVDAAVKAQSPHHRATPEMMEFFYNDVFRTWTTEGAPIPVEDLTPLPDYEAV